MDTEHGVLLLIGVLIAALIVIVILKILYRVTHKHAPKKWRMFASSERGMEGRTVEEMYPPELAAMFNDHFAQEHPEAVAFGLGEDGRWHKYPIGGDSNAEDGEIPEPEEEHPKE